MDNKTLPDDETLLTTIDNPYNPFLNWDSWYAFDTEKGYHTCAYLARVCQSSSELPEEDQNLAISQAMQEIVDLNLSGKHKLISRKDFVLAVKIK